MSNSNTLFLRYSHDGNDTFAPLGAPNLPSNWRKNTNWSDQSIGGLTSAWRLDLVNELRFAYSYWRNRSLHPAAADCPGDCLGLGLPQIEVLGRRFRHG